MNFIQEILKMLIEEDEPIHASEIVGTIPYKCEEEQVVAVLETYVLCGYVVMYRGKYVEV